MLEKPQARPSEHDERVGPGRFSARRERVDELLEGADAARAELSARMLVELAQGVS
jgi:hypothetical protein